VRRIVGYLCVPGGNTTTASTFAASLRGGCTLKGQQARQKISKEVGKSGYQPATSRTGTVLCGYTDSLVSATSARKWEESARKANREAAARATPGKGTTMGSQGTVSGQGQPGELWDQGPGQASARGGKMGNLDRTPGNLMSKSKGYLTRGQNLEVTMDVEAHKQGRKSHLKKITDDILEQQWQEKLKLQDAKQVPDPHASMKGDPAMIYQKGEVVWYEASDEEPRLARIS
jgi:hypothetical protein